MRKLVMATMGAAMVLVACTPPLHTPSAGDEPITWGDVRRDGLGGARFAVVVSPYPDKTAGGSRLGLVDPDGTTRFLDVALDSGRIAGRPGLLCASTADASLTIGRGDARRGAAGALPWGGSGRVLLGHSCPWTLGDGEVTWEQDGRSVSAAVPTRNPTVGLSPDAMWVRDSEEWAFPGPIRLSRVDLATGSVEEIAEWPNQVGTVGDRRLVADHGLTDLFWHDGRVHWLEEVSGYVGEGDERGDIRPGVGAEVHLVSVDPAGRAERTRVLETRSGLTQARDGRESSAAWALSTGHLHEGALYVGSGDGEIVAIDLATRTARVAGTLSPRSRDAKDETAAWHEGTLSLLLREESGRVVIEDYDLDAGELAGTTELSGLDGVLDGRSYLERIAVVGR